MEIYNHIYRLRVSLYPEVLTKKNEELIWMVAESLVLAINGLRAEYPTISISGTSSIFGRILAVDNFDYCAEIYETTLRLKNRTDTIIHVLANNISDATSLYTQVYTGVIKASITVLPGTVLPKKIK